MNTKSAKGILLSQCPTLGGAQMLEDMARVPQFPPCASAQFA